MSAQVSTIIIGGGQAGLARQKTGLLLGVGKAAEHIAAHIVARKS